MYLGLDKVFTRPQLYVYGTGAALLALAYVANLIAYQFDTDPTSVTHIDSPLQQALRDFLGLKPEQESVFGYRANLILEAGIGLLFVAAVLSARANSKRNQNQDN